MQAKRHSSPHAGYWRIAGKPTYVAVKVKAHRSEADAESPLELCHVRGNAWADHEAKKAARGNNMCNVDLKAFNDARKLYR